MMAKMKISEQGMAVGMKILGGEKLSKEEFKVAMKEKLYANPKLTYDELMRTWYEDDKQKGYLATVNGKIASRTVSKKGNKTTIRIYGVCREDVDPKFLRPEQKDLW